MEEGPDQVAAAGVDGAAEPRGATPRELVAEAMRRRDFALSARRLWLLSMAAYRSGHPRLAALLKNLNSALYHNALPYEVQAAADVRLGHHGTGTVLHPKLRIGEHVKIFQNVTIAVRPPLGANEVVLEEGVVIGANAVIITPRRRSIRIGRGAMIGAGAVVTHDVPEKSIAISPPAEIRPRAQWAPGPEGEEEEEE